MEGANSAMHIPEMDKYGPPIFNEPVREGMQSEVHVVKLKLVRGNAIFARGGRFQYFTKDLIAEKVCRSVGCL